MKYLNSIEIDLPRERVAQLLADPTNIQKWVRGVVLHEPLTGTHGQVGTTSRVVLRSGKQEIECTETVTRREPADLHDIPTGVVVRFDREMVAPGMWSMTRDRLTEVDHGTTLWESESEYRFSGLMMRLFALVLPRTFRTQSQQHMQDFKEFAEHGKDVRDGEN